MGPTRIGEGLIARAAIDTYVARIVERFHPERVILFGSYAKGGTPTEDSDVDLLVVMPYEGKPWDKATELCLALGRQFAMDLIVEDWAWIQREVADENWFWIEVLDRGELLYESQDCALASAGRG